VIDTIQNIYSLFTIRVIACWF